MATAPTASEGMAPPTKVRRVISQMACDACRRSKVARALLHLDVRPKLRSQLRCDISALITTSSEAECTRCKSAGKTCIVGEPPKRGRRRATSQMHVLPSFDRTPNDLVCSPNSLGDDRLDKNPRLVSPLRDLPSLDSAALGLFTPPTPSETALFQAPPPKAQPDNVLLGTQSPLMLLADASHLAGHTSTGPGSLTLAEGASLRGVNIDRAVLADGLRLLCEPIDGPRAEPPSISPNDYLATSSRSAVKRDLGADLDPVQLGLVDEADLAYLFDVVFNEDFQYCPCLSPNIHTPAFVRARSNLLLTAILLLAAQTLPGQALLATRLRAHAAMLQREIVLRRCRSLEIVQALQCLSLWKCAGASAEEDQSVLALAYATVVAVEIGLDKVDQAFLQLEPEIDFEVYKLCVRRSLT